MVLHQIIYVSSACTLMSERELKALMAQSGQFNAARQITGLLLYKDGNFMQLLEGDQAELNSLMERIKVDRRHFGLSVLVNEPAVSRLYPEWAMGFRSLSPDETMELPGYSDFLTQPEKTPRPRDRCSKMLHTFRRSM